MQFCTIIYALQQGILLAARTRVWACSRSRVGIEGSNPARSMEIFLLSVLCVVR